MEEMYNVMVNIKTLRGMQEIGTFVLGTDRDFAHCTFDSLKGDTKLVDNPIIRIDLVIKTASTLPVRLKSITCTLDQYAENCKIITRDVFKYFTLEK